MFQALFLNVIHLIVVQGSDGLIEDYLYTSQQLKNHLEHCVLWPWNLACLWSTDSTQYLNKLTAIIYSCAIRYSSTVRGSGMWYSLISMAAAVS